MQRSRVIFTRASRRIGGNKKMDERGWGPDRHLPEDHSWARELLGPYVLGALDLEEEKAVGWHIAWCAACQKEERGLRETHERLSAASIAASSAPSYLKAHVFSALPARDGSEAPDDDGSHDGIPYGRAASDGVLGGSSRSGDDGSS